jgi:glycosyltransferase involved in cell wall biosynthesis
MKILFVIPYVPSLVRVRSYQIVRHVKARGHHVTLATVTTNQQEKNELEQFSQYCDEVIVTHLPTYRSLMNCTLALPSSLPLQSVYSWDARLFNHIQEQLWDGNGKPSYDLIHIEHLRGSQYGIRLKGLSDQNPGHRLPPIVWDSVDCISYLFTQAAAQSKQGFKRWITQFDLHRTERREGWLPQVFEQVLVTSKKDKDALLALSSEDKKNIHIIPNGVDLNYFQTGDPDEREAATLVISGKMSYHANVSMVLFLTQEVMPLVWAANPEVKLWIVGKDPTPEINAFATHPAITVTGTVDSLLPYLQKATIAVAPIQYGAGIQNKVLEGMACATPVIATSLATSALQIEPGKEVIVADTPEAWRDAILDLIASRQKQVQIGEAGRQYVEENHRWPEIAHKLENIYQQAISQKLEA